MSKFDQLTMVEFAKYLERYSGIVTFHEEAFHGAFTHEMFGVFLAFPTWEVSISDSGSFSAPTLSLLLEEMDKIHPITHNQRK